MGATDFLAVLRSAPPADADTASLPAGQSEEKRRQILAGAREVFLASGFDGASMGEITRAAGVSKGTLYVYFGSKEELFTALVREECGQTAEHCFVLDVEADVRGALTQTAHRYVEAMIRPETIATVRMVLGVTEKFPEIGKAYLSAGQEAGARRLSEWLRAKIAREELSIADVELAAWQFMTGCNSMIVTPILFGDARAPEASLVERVVSHTVNSFMSAYARRRRKGDEPVR